MNTQFTTAARPILVTGTPRSGTEAFAIANELDHESTLTWQQGNGVVDFQRFAQARNPAQHGFNDAFHLVRDPYRTIASLAELCHPNNGHWAWMQEQGMWVDDMERYVWLRDSLDKYKHPIANAAIYWYMVHGWLMHCTSAGLIRLEDQPFYNSKLQGRFGRVSLMDIKTRGDHNTAVGVYSLAKAMGYEQ